jgi:type II secretory pathway pseudopilin PulG
MKRKKSAFSLIEVLVAFVITIILMGALLSVFIASNDSWKRNQKELDKQQLARGPLNIIIEDLRKSSPDWEVDGIHYPVAINTDGTQIDYYLPEFDSDNKITGLKGARIYLVTTGDVNQLFRKIGTESARVIGSYIDDSFSSRPYFQFATTDNNVVQVNIPIIKTDTNVYRLTTKVYLRNSSNILSGVTVEPLEEEGES